ncbi:hypothetical protein N658DRAFT_418362 [Parathielavia hyrcaniae]|uniref:Uncharacterized protein n=1 Tax=Parathielavia hyrcaniae TaxID=113614 RepID=A0AAN6QBX7_9PEZI|nr:hypothetical protein N658DRAFT_418362 [Parathielavia hyrcaniae]
MAVFVDLGEEDGRPVWHGPVDAVKPMPVTAAASNAIGEQKQQRREEAQGRAVAENLNRNSMTQALGCYPIIMSVASSIDLNTLDNLSRTCRQIRENLLQYRKMLLVSTLHCTNEHLPVDPEEVFRFRARAANWYYMQDAGRSSYHGKSGQCARDLVAECRRCGTVVCRNCMTKPPAPIALPGRHRRLCSACVTAPLGLLVSPQLGPDVRLDSDEMVRAVCTCESVGVWLCQPCGRSIRGDDLEYKGIWRWRNNYTEVLGGLGTGIGEGDRGVICGREDRCCAAREREQEMDGDAEDAREAEYYQQTTATQRSNSSGSSSSGSSSNGATPSTLAPWTLSTTASVSSLASSSGGAGSALDRRTPSPALKPGYEGHEVEGIGGVMKKLRVRMVKVGACVPEWDDERARGEVLGREVQGRRRSWCGWCRRVIPSRKDSEADRGSEGEGEGKGKEKGASES